MRLVGAAKIILRITCGLVLAVAAMELAIRHVYHRPTVFDPVLGYVVAPGSTVTWARDRMFTLETNGVRWAPTVLFLSTTLVVLGHVLGAAIDAAGDSTRFSRLVTAGLSVVNADLRPDGISGWYVRLGVGTVPGSFMLAAWLLLIFFFAPTGSSPFIYFQF